MTFTVLPVAAFFLRLITFWSVCSFYVFLDIDLPVFLKEQMDTIFIAVNASLLKLLGFDFNPKLFLSGDSANEKVSEELQESVGLTLDYFALNCENLLLFALSMAILSIVYAISRIKVTREDEDGETT